MAKGKEASIKFNEIDSMNVIKEMISVSRNRLENNGILFIIWGWIMFIIYLRDFIIRQITITYTFKMIVGYIGSALMIIAILLTIYFVFIKRKNVKTFISDILKLVWFTMAACLVLTNLVIFNRTEAIDYSLQNPIFMLFIASAILISGGILRYKLLIAGGVVFALLAFACSFLDLQYQLLLEAVAYLIGFIIPGHILYRKRKLARNV